MLRPYWDGVNAMNPMAVPDLDAAMAGAGAIPQLLDIFAGLGFQVEAVGDD